MNYKQIPSPCYVIDEQLLRKNLSLIKSVKERAEVEIILAFKAFAAWQVFPIFHEYGFRLTTASSLSEALLAKEEMGSLAHTYAPAYIEREFSAIMECSSHITFNSLAQYEQFRSQIANRKSQIDMRYETSDVRQSQIASRKSQISCGLRINPEVSVVETDLYNPTKAGSRLGIVAEQMPAKLPEDVEGLHFHVLCESSSYDLEKVLTAVEGKFGKYISQIKWLNMGGGHLMTREDYDVEHLISLLKSFRAKYPHLQIILEPGAAFVWRTGVLRSTVIDIVENHGIKTAILDVSFACHMPDCLEMPYQPAIVGACHCGLAPQSPFQSYRMGGNSCLSGDYVGDWVFNEPLKVGDDIIFEDMIHYTTVKTTMFNGISHPSIGIWTKNNEFRLLRAFGYEDYKSRMC
ncbi:MAG: carboxynorspermidine decarboxylase [Prevotellaceae bacterium]|jgi:carboxynorspermidine decarboxylase|nr:carboxynorspermidine decarboxylase [Prevotellaceae bacterium]